MARGRVKWYSADLGYGFIIPDDGGVEVLVRHEEITGDGEFKSLDNNVEVTYEAVRGAEGTEAKNVSGVREPVGRRLRQPARE